MDLPETHAERQARHFAWLRRVGNRTMNIAEAAGAAAEAELNPPKEQPAPPRPAGALNYIRIFMQAAAAIRQIIALELRVEAGPPARRAAERPPPVPPKPDPRRPLLQQVLHDAIRLDPNKARRRREIDAEIEQRLLADPDPAHAEIIAETLHAICTKLHIDLDLNRISDAFLDYDSPVKTPVRNKFRDDSS